MSTRRDKILWSLLNLSIYQDISMVGRLVMTSYNCCHCASLALLKKKNNNKKIWENLSGHWRNISLASVSCMLRSIYVDVTIIYNKIHHSSSQWLRNEFLYILDQSIDEFGEWLWIFCVLYMCTQWGIGAMRSVTWLRK